MNREDRPWWMRSSPSCNKKRWDADVVYWVIMEGRRHGPYGDIEAEHMREFELTRNR